MVSVYVVLAYLCSFMLHRGQSLCVSDCVCACVDAVGEQGRAKDPDVVNYALLQHMVRGT